MAKPRAVGVPRRPELRLPVPDPFSGPGLAPDGDYDSLHFDGVTLDRQDGAGARFLDCLLTNCTADATGLRATRLLDSRIEGLRGVGTDLAESSLRDVEIHGARLGSTLLHGSRWERVLVHGGKFEYLNLRGAVLRDVVFEDCVLIEPDLKGAQLERVSFPGSTVRGADVDTARLRDVDLREAAEFTSVRGLRSLSGAVISPAQLLDLAPEFAAELGVRVGE